MKMMALICNITIQDLYLIECLKSERMMRFPSKFRRIKATETISYYYYFPTPYNIKKEDYVQIMIS